jgi:formylglycine-generating enzyme required for sulfatase activity
MAGNVWQQVDDCYAEKLDGAPTDGSAWKEACKGDLPDTVVRGGSWVNPPEFLRSANRYPVGLMSPLIGSLGFRVGRTLLAP